jgi:hypothetical protein
MPTENPKISAYVPQALFDRFKRFQEERGLTMSQATIALMSEYFGLEQTVKGSSLATVGGITLERIEMIESELRRLSELVDKPKIDSELQSSFQDELPRIDMIDESPVQSLDDEVETRENLEPVSESKIQSTNEGSLPLVILGELPREIIINGNLLAKRLGILSSKLSKYKNSYELHKFIKFLQEKDPDGVIWEPLKGRKGYVAVSELSGELKNKLLQWISENSD